MIGVNVHDNLFTDFVLHGNGVNKGFDLNAEVFNVVGDFGEIEFGWGLVAL